MLTVIRLVGLFLFCHSMFSLWAAQLETELPHFLDQYCVKCHGPEKQKGDRRFDQLKLPIEDTVTLIQLQDILDILNLGEMPPEEEEKRPNVPELLQTIESLTETISLQKELLASTQRKTVLRRLNRREYQNTIRDLFQMNVSLFDPTQSFPPDQEIEHVDTLGDQLVTSSYLWERYFEAADQIVEKVFAVQEKPAVQHWTFTDNFKGIKGLDTVMDLLANYEYIALYDLPASEQHNAAYGTIYDFLQGVPYDGQYHIRLLAEAKNRKHNHIRRISSVNPEQPLELGIVPGDVRVGGIGRTQHIEPVLASFTLPDEQPEWFEADVWLDAGYTPRFIFPNGTLNVRSAFRQTFAEYASLLDVELANDYQNRRYITLKYGKLPHIRIHTVEISGPYLEEWPPLPQQIVLGGKPFSPERAEGLLHQFASRAYRRPATDAETQEVVRFYRERVENGIPAFDAFKDGLKRILCAPGFIYMHEPADGIGTLSDYALASRLSYFLWSSMPDDELRQLAADGRLSDPSVLRTQVRRMLKDEKAQALVHTFVDRFLTLKDLGSQPPDRRRFKLYYERYLQKYMYEETERFIDYCFRENRPLTDLIDADYSFINESLAELYGYEDVRGLNFRKIDIGDSMRKGILGHASILTVTANGIDTSPVIRGVWLLDTILGTPPSPPPPDVEPFDPDTRGAVSLRDQLEKHRQNPTCYDCHRKIDPLGFALESFDPIGKLRTEYDNKLPVDTSGRLPDGSSFHSAAELKRILLQRRPQMIRSFTRKWLSFATGRGMELADRQEIDAIVEQLHDRGDGFRDLIELVALSDIMRKK